MPLIDENHMTFEVKAINSGWFGDEKKIRTTLGHQIQEKRVEAERGKKNGKRQFKIRNYYALPVS